MSEAATPLMTIDESPALGVDEHSLLVIRNCGPIGYPAGRRL